jgi:tetratricopeptide (TPR) repeat protein
MTARGGTPERIGGYRIVRKIAEGGMGVVYEAEQDHPRRTVALKVIRPGLATSQILRRFEHEVQILGWLVHPGIAQIYEAGTADAGFGPQPFFAMELVRGASLVEYVLEDRTSVRGRLELVARICDAVHHAHQKGVIHRDLKPGNILVTESGQPKILDFGVARSMDSDLRRTTMETGVGQLVGTLAYMSPEQAGGDPRDLDTRSDVYSLGVIAYEVLTDTLPYDVENRLPHEVVRRIREEDPAPLRSRSRFLHRDIETIVAKALEKERSRRYESAAAMAEDIRRFLRDEPIAARPASTVYQIKKFAKRNKALVGGVVAVFVVLVAGIVATSVALEREAEQRRRAELEARRSRAVADFTQEMLSAVDPSVAGDLDKTLMRLILDTAARRVESELAGEPEIEALIRDTIGSTYSSLGLYDEGRPHLERAVAILERTYGRDHPYTMVSLVNLSLLLSRAGELEKAETILREVVENRRRIAGEEHPETVEATINLASLLHDAGEIEEAESLLRRGVEVTLEAKGEEDPVSLTARNNLGLFLVESGHPDEAERLLDRVLELERRVLGPDHPNTILTLSNLAQAVSDLGRDAEAETLLKEALEGSRRVLGEDHPETFKLRSNLAVAMRRNGNLDEAEDLLRETLDAQRTRLGESHPATLATMNNLAGVLRDRRRYDEAAELLRACLEMLRRDLGPEHPNTLSAMNNLATVLENAGRLAEAEPLQRESLDVLRGVLGEEHPTVLALTNNLAYLLQRQGKLDEAEAAYRRLLEAAPGALPEGHWHLGVYRGLYGDCLLRLERFDDSERQLLASYRCFREALGEEDRQTRRAVERLVELYEAWGKREEADAWRAKVAAAPDPSRDGVGEGR